MNLKCQNIVRAGRFFPFFALFLSTRLFASILVFDTPGQPPLNSPDLSGFMDRVTADALRRIGITLQTLHLPAERGLKNVNNGIEDGEMCRIAGLEKLYPNLVRVPEKIMDWDFVAFSVQPLDVRDWGGLNGLTVGFINGWKIFEENVPKEVVATRVRIADQLFTLLSRDRAEVVLYERWSGLYLAQSLGLRSVKLLDPPLASREMFMYLNIKHVDLVPKLTEALREVKRDGTYERIKAETLNMLVEPVRILQE